jgi:hypothetical protein
MNEWILISLVLVAILVLIGIVLTLVFWKKKEGSGIDETNYQVFFILGICLFPVGLVFLINGNIAFIGLVGMGLIYLIIGLSNRNKWEKKK